MSPRMIIIILKLFILVVPLCIYDIIRNFVMFFIPGQLRKKDIKGQNVLITGAGSGIGREIAIEFSKYSVCLILVDINRESLLQTEKLLDRCSTVFIYDCDVSDRQMVYKMAKKVKEEAGDVDILVNNAGIVQGKYLMDSDDEKIVKTFEVNTLAHFWTCKAFLPGMMEKNRGHIVSITSVGGKAGGPKISDYCSSKFAAVGFAESLEMELREKGFNGIKLTIVYPYHVDTGLFDGFKLTTEPPRSAQYIARNVVKGVLEEEEDLVLPPIYKYLLLTKAFLPRWIIIKLAEMTGDIKCMENFKGRTTAENQQNTAMSRKLK